MVGQSTPATAVLRALTAAASLGARRLPRVCLLSKKSSSAFPSPAVSATATRCYHPSLCPVKDKNNVWTTKDTLQEVQHPDPPACFNRYREHYFTSIAPLLAVTEYDHAEATAEAEAREARAKEVADAHARGLDAPPEVEPRAPARWIDGRRHWTARVKYRVEQGLYDLGIPHLTGVTVSQLLPRSYTNRYYLSHSYAVVQALVNQHPTTLYSHTDDNLKGVRKGAPVGCMAFLHGDDMWGFIERLFIALARVKDWKGLRPQSGTGGSMTVLIKASDLTAFSELEPVLENVAHRGSIVVSFNSTAKNPVQARRFFSALGFPIMEQKDIPRRRTATTTFRRAELFEGEHARAEKERQAKKLKAQFYGKIKREVKERRLEKNAEKMAIIRKARADKMRPFY